MVSGRGGLVGMETIKAQVDFLEQVLKKVEKLAQKKPSPDALETLVAALLGSFRIPANRQAKYLRRLRYGLQHYYIRHFHPSNNAGGEE